MIHTANRRFTFISAFPSLKKSVSSFIGRSSNNEEGNIQLKNLERVAENQFSLSAAAIPSPQATKTCLANSEKSD